MIKGFIILFDIDDIIESLMNYYKDFNYIGYILSLDFESGFKLYRKGLERIKDYSYNKLWDLYLVDRLMGYKNNFNEYKKENELQNKTKSMNYEDKINKENEIFHKINKLDHSRFKKVVF
jgi:hypothetical protein